MSLNGYYCVNTNIHTHTLAADRLQYLVQEVISKNVLKKHTDNTLFVPIVLFSCTNFCCTQ